MPTPTIHIQKSNRSTNTITNTTDSNNPRIRMHLLFLNALLIHKTNKADDTNKTFNTTKHACAASTSNTTDATNTTSTTETSNTTTTIPTNIIVIPILSTLLKHI